MESRERLHLHEYCIVPFRLTETGVEFCLLTPHSENRWEFPKTPAIGHGEAPLHDAASAAGLRGQVSEQEPLGEFQASRGSQRRTVTAFLMHVDKVDDDWQQQESHRRLWCLAEEGRVRIRRKPMRRFIDLALHAIHAGTQNATAGSRGPKGAPRTSA